MPPIDVTTLTPEERAQLETQLAALDEAQQQLAATAAAAEVPHALAGDPTAPQPTAPQPTAPQPTAPTSGYVGPTVGETVSHTFVDPYADDAEVTRYGLVIRTLPADPNVPDAVDRAEIVWLPEGTAVLDVADLDSV